jgi:pilus assembly protein Flp/PilA
MNAIKNFILDEEGAAAVEYGLLAVVIAVGIVIGVRAFAGDLCAVFKGLGNFVRGGSTGAFAADAC